jgi:hypothetical protein
MPNHQAIVTINKQIDDLRAKTEEKRAELDRSLAIALALPQLHEDVHVAWVHAFKPAPWVTIRIPGCHERTWPQSLALAADTMRRFDCCPIVHVKGTFTYLKPELLVPAHERESAKYTERLYGPSIDLSRHVNHSTDTKITFWARLDMPNDYEPAEDCIYIKVSIEFSGKYDIGSLPPPGYDLRCTVQTRLNDGSPAQVRWEGVDANHIGPRITWGGQSQLFHQLTLMFRTWQEFCDAMNIDAGNDPFSD